jgi:two-component system phosphate regulon sensor histidine kinase PhoR
MNRKRFTILIFMMLLSIIGIIWIQVVWITKAVGIRNESFNNAVIVSLNNAATEIEASMRMNFFSNYMLNRPLSIEDTSGNVSGFMSIESYSSQPGNRVSVNITNHTFTGNSDTARITTRNGDGSIITDSSSFYIAVPDETGKMKIIKRGEEQHTGPNPVYIRQNEFLDWLRRRADQFRNMSDQMIADMYQWERTLQPDNRDIAFALTRSLTYSGIETPYEYAVIKNGAVLNGVFKKSDKQDFLKSRYKINLFTDNIVRNDLSLSVIFPERTNYVLGSMMWLLGGSMLFSLFILVTFALSLYFIIRQKKITEMKSDFLNNMTHEFKTPIATISLAADTITNPRVIKNEESIRHFIGMIKKENSRMNKKVETILQIASLDKKEIEFKFENVSLHTIIHHAVETIEIQVQQRSGKIFLRLEALEDEILGDFEHLSNLVNNFLDNAIKYSPDSPEITVSTNNTERGIILSFEDKGIGMSKSVQGKIFERFYRQTSGNVHDVKGFGLGLNYARAIIDAHKGNVTIFSEPGKGSRFDIFLPFNCEN